MCEYVWFIGVVLVVVIKILGLCGVVKMGGVGCIKKREALCGASRFFLSIFNGCYAIEFTWLILIGAVDIVFLKIIESVSRCILSL